MILTAAQLAPITAGYGFTAKFLPNQLLAGAWRAAPALRLRTAEMAGELGVDLKKLQTKIGASKARDLINRLWRKR